jgi:S1-C subfamily serine protease
MQGEAGRAGSRGLPRETRLLIVTLVISGLVLVLLAQFRFPDRSQRAAARPATALDELATRAAFEAQAAALREVGRRLDGSLALLRARRADRPDGETFLLAGLRIRDDIAVAIVPVSDAAPYHTLEARGPAGWIPAPLVGVDEPRGLVVVRIPTTPAPVLAVGPETPRTPGYFAAAIGGQASPSLSPIWLTALTAIERSIWSGSVWALPHNGTLAPGTSLFSIDGALVGLVADGLEGPLLVPAAVILGRATELAAGRSFRGADIGCEMVDLATPALRSAAGRADGALVGWIDPGGPANGLLQTGDIVTAIDAEPVRTAADVARAMARREAGARPVVTIVRGGQAESVPIVVRAPVRGIRAAPASVPVSAGLGLVLRQTASGLAVQSVHPRGAAAGVVAAGDRITWLRGETRLTPEAVERAYAALASGAALLLRIAPAEAPDRSPPPAPSPERTVAILKP